MISTKKSRIFVSMKTDERLRFLSIGSGSSGNCYYFGDGQQGILIDAGIAARTIRKALRAIGTDFDHILGVFVSHDHVDHIKSVGTLGEGFHLPVYATTGTHHGIERSWGVTQKLNGSRRYLTAGESTTVGPFTMTPYPVSHDASDCVCFSIAYGKHKILVATDLGCANEAVSELIRQSTIVILEANYDAAMLQKGPYPYYLKKRIVGDEGHLCNDETGRLLAENWHDDLTHVFLCHLSKDNNAPSLALQTVESCLREAGVTYGKGVRIEPLSRNLHSLIEFDD